MGVERFWQRSKASGAERGNFGFKDKDCLWFKASTT